MSINVSMHQPTGAKVAEGNGYIWVRIFDGRGSEMTIFTTHRIATAIAAAFDEPVEVDPAPLDPLTEKLLTDEAAPEVVVYGEWRSTYGPDEPDPVSLR